MKGVVFAEFLDLVEDKFGYEVVDQILPADSESEGAYTAIGTYDYQELIQMVVKLSESTALDLPVLVRTFGRHLFGRFAEKYGETIKDFHSAFDLLENIEDCIHVEVAKLYPNAELPNFEYDRPNENTLVMVYRSSRPFAELCHGLIEQCVEHFGEEEIEIVREDLLDDGTMAKFTLTKIR